MDTLLGSSRWHWRATDWTAAAVSGFAAGAVLMVLDLLWSALFNPDGPWRTSHMIAPIFIGTDTLKATGYNFSVSVVAIALATHYTLGMVFGLAMGWLMAQFRLDSGPGPALVAGMVMGVALYLLNFEVLAAFFPWLASLRGVATFVAHLVFGVVAALLYCRLERIPVER
jgi:hypothetical protein